MYNFMDMTSNDFKSVRNALLHVLPTAAGRISGVEES